MGYFSEKVQFFTQAGDRRNTKKYLVKTFLYSLKLYFSDKTARQPSAHNGRC